MNGLVGYGSSDEESTEDEVIQKEDNPPMGVEVKTATSGALGDGDKVEPEYQMRVPKSAKVLGMLSGIQASRSKTGKVLLSVPTLEELDSDESDDDSVASRSKKKPIHKSGSTRGGLLSLLPPIRGMVVREGDKPMIPRQLISRTKDPPKKVTEPPSVNARSTAEEEEWEDEILKGAGDVEQLDEEDQASGFFSFYKPEDSDANEVASVRATAAAKSAMSLLGLSGLSASASSQTPLLPPLNPIDPKVLEQMPKSDTDKQVNAEDEAEEQACWSEETFVPGPERKRARMNMPGTRALPVAELLSTSHQVIHEVNQADLTAGADLELMKSITSDESQYVSKRAAEDDDPGQLAHRKHQITWLAFQSQANEVDLEKRWAEARRNKQSNRAKYGF
ncbi:unnamed protein product [Calicophoron daubneyi]|uniref:Proline-rich protein PRCC n=1 Tax=Calicophoron daubneyi TaxID=300641 RepID=A0AAV2T0S5_CALDB